MTKTYPSQPPVVALRGISFAVAEGELVAIAGPSGSGKSTLLHLMGTLDRPTAGTVRVTGLDVAALSDRELSALRAVSIGFVFQQFFLAEHATALDNVADGAAVCRGRNRRAPPPGRPRAAAGRAGPQAGRPADADVGRGAAAGRDRPRGGGPAGDRAGRRAHRQPRLRRRRRAAGPVRRTQRRRSHHHRDHPRPRHRRPAAPPDRRARRPHRRRYHHTRAGQPASQPDPATRSRRTARTRCAAAGARPARKSSHDRRPHARAGQAAPVRPGPPRRGGAAHPQAARRPVRPGDRHRSGRDRRRAGPVRVLPERAAHRDPGAGHQPAHRAKRPGPGRRHRRAADRRPGHDRPPARRHRRPGHRDGRRQRLPQPADPRHPHQCPDRRCRQPRPARRRRHLHRPGRLPQRRHRPRAGRRARRRRRSVPGHRPDLARRADLGRPHVVLRCRDPQARCPGPRDRHLGADRLPRRRAIPRFRRPPVHHLRQSPGQPGHRGGQPARRDRPTPRTPARSRCPSRHRR